MLVELSLLLVELSLLLVELSLLLVVDESLLDVVLDDVPLESDACAATPIASVPARLAATSAPVSSDVRRNPASRFIPRPLR